MDFEFLTCLLKFIKHFPDHLSVLSRMLLCFSWTTFVETAVYLKVIADYVMKDEVRKDKVARSKSTNLFKTVQPKGTKIIPLLLKPGTLAHKATQVACGHLPFGKCSNYCFYFPATKRMVHKGTRALTFFDNTTQDSGTTNCLFTDLRLDIYVSDYRRFARRQHVCCYHFFGRKKYPTQK